MNRALSRWAKPGGSYGVKEIEALLPWNMPSAAAQEG